MSADLLYPTDFKTKSRGYTKIEGTKTEPPIVLAKIESEIAFALWGGPIFPSIDDIPTDYDPRPA